MNDVIYAFIIMTETEKRRLDLLTRTRNLYSPQNAPPAIHPRYRAAFRFLYEEKGEEEEITTNSFWARFFIAALVFVLVAVTDVQKRKIGTVDSKTVITEVRKDLFGQ